MIRKSMPSGLSRWVDTGFPKGSCSTKDLERDVDSTESDRGLGSFVIACRFRKSGFRPSGQFPRACVSGTAGFGREPKIRKTARDQSRAMSAKLTAHDRRLFGASDGAVTETPAPARARPSDFRPYKQRSKDLFGARDLFGAADASISATTPSRRRRLICPGPQSGARDAILCAALRCGARCSSAPTE
jgi:hypothetical protein